MENQQATELLYQILNSLNEISVGAYVKVFSREANSIDFITDCEVKKFIGISYAVDQRLSLHLQPEITIRGSQLRMRISLGANIKMKDFTANNNEDIQYYNFFFQYSYLFTGKEDKNWLRKIRELNKEVIQTATRLQRKYIPSQRLSKIVGREAKPKYQILDLFSDYIIRNNLRLSNGSIKIEGDLKPFYRKNTHTVCENTIFDTLRENVLINETQLKLVTCQYKFRTRRPPTKRELIFRPAVPWSVEYVDSPL